MPFSVLPAFADEAAPAMVPDCTSAVLMEASTGTVLFEYHPDMLCPPASITKIMTLLLVMEAIEEGKLKTDDVVTAGAHAASMGGSQIYLKEGERMTVEDLIKSVVISSANDAALALAVIVSVSFNVPLSNASKTRSIVITLVTEAGGSAASAFFS